VDVGPDADVDPGQTLNGLVVVRRAALTAEVVPELRGADESTIVALAASRIGADELVDGHTRGRGELRPLIGRRRPANHAAVIENDRPNRRRPIALHRHEVSVLLV